jgi:SAM-dependent methyltransferase
VPAEQGGQAPPSPEDWPGERIRNPNKSSVTYPTRIHLARWLEEEAKRAAADFGRFRVLDIGCGRKPYFPYFAQNADEYVGVDIDIENPMADLHAPVEDLPVADESFDVVLCTQVLEHCGVPDQAVTELYRVAAPGGRVLASTHGVQVYHPSPEDHWRWTHTGLELQFLRNAAWRSVTVAPAGGTATCLASMTGIYLDILFRRIHLAPLAKGLVWLLNSSGAALDGRVSSLRATRPGSIFLNYHVVAEKAP